MNVGSVSFHLSTCSSSIIGGAEILHPSNQFESTGALGFPLDNLGCACDGMFQMTASAELRRRVYG
jgi:hypothetical protein